MASKRFSNDSCCNFCSCEGNSLVQLRCFHLACLSCLEHLTKQAPRMIKGADEDDEDGGSPTFLQCTLCSKPNSNTEESRWRIPTGGSWHDFKKETKEDPVCSMFGDRSVSNQSHKCEVNLNCGLPGKNSFRPPQKNIARELGDSKILETVLEKLTKRKLNLQRESQAAELEIHRGYESAVRHAKKARDINIAGLTNGTTALMVAIDDDIILAKTYLEETREHTVSEKSQATSWEIWKEKDFHRFLKLMCEKENKCYPEYCPRADRTDSSGSLVTGEDHAADVDTPSRFQLDRDLALKTEHETIKQTVQKHEASFEKLEANVGTHALHIETFGAGFRELEEKGEKLKAEVAKLNTNDEKLEAMEKRMAIDGNLKENVVKLEDHVQKLAADGEKHKTDHEKLKKNIVTLEDHVQKLAADSKEHKTDNEERKAKVLKLEDQLAADSKEHKTDNEELKAEVLKLEDQLAAYSKEHKTDNEERKAKVLKLEDQLAVNGKEHKQENKELKTKVLKLEDQLAVNGTEHKQENEELKAKVLKLEDQLAVYGKEHKQENEELKAKVLKLEEHAEKRKTDDGNLEAKVQMLKEQGVRPDIHFEKRMVSAENDIKSINGELEKEKTAFAELEAKMGNITVRVAFHSKLGVAVTTQQQQILICDNIVTNVGDGYSSRTGIFTAPVSGVYCFLATSSPFQDDNSKSAVLNIILEDKAIAYLSASGKGKCTAHSSVPVKAGQKVWLRSHGDGEYTFYGGSTFFTGMLVQAEI